MRPGPSCCKSVKNQIVHATIDRIQSAVEAKDLKAVIPSHIDYATYLVEGGYKTLKRCLADELTWEEVITTLESSELRGLGGAGFPDRTKVAHRQRVPQSEG